MYKKTLILMTSSSLLLAMDIAAKERDRIVQSDQRQERLDEQQERRDQRNVRMDQRQERRDERNDLRQDQPTPDRVRVNENIRVDVNRDRYRDELRRENLSR